MKLKEIINLDIKLSKGANDLRLIFKGEDISMKHALNCNLLYTMFLENSGNLLLIEVLKAGNHRGKNGLKEAIRIFNKIW